MKGFRKLGEALFSLGLTERTLGRVIANQAGDTTAPTCIITANASGATAAAFTCTFTFSEDVTGFVLGDITVGNGAAGTFATVSPSVYTAVITPTATGTVTVDVGAGVCTDAAGNANIASNAFSILAVLAKLWVDFSDITTLFQDSAGTTPVTTDGQPIGYVADKSATGNHPIQATGAVRPTYKTNILNGLSVARFDGGDNLAKSTPTGFVTGTGARTIIIVTKASASAGVQTPCGDGAAATGQRFDLFLNSAGETSIAFENIRYGEASFFPNFNVYSLLFPAGETLVSKSKIYKNNTALTMSFRSGADQAINTSGVVVRLGANAGGTQNLNGDIAEYLYFPGELSTSSRNAVENYLSAKWNVSF